MKARVLIPLSAVAVLVISAAAFASGFGYYEQGAKATSMGGAFVARADDVTALFYNPAGIAFLEGTNFHVAMHPVNLNFTSKFMGTTTEGINEWLTPASTFFSAKLSDDVVFGFGFFVPFGLTVDWPSEWVGSQLSFHSALRSYYFQPTIAYKVNDQFSVAAGFDIVRSKVELCRILVHPMTVSPALPELDVKTFANIAGTGTGYGVNLGMLYKVNPKFNFGVSYKSEVSIDYEGDVDFSPFTTGIPDADAVVGTIFSDQKVRTEIKMPQILAFGTMIKAAENVNLQIDLQWTGWSSFDKLDIDFDNDMLNQTDPNNWEDAWTLRIGAEYLVTPYWGLRAGYIYDQGTVPSTTLKPLLPDTTRNWITFGLGYDTLEACCWGRFACDLAVMYFPGSEFDSTHPLFPSNYEADALILGMGITIAF